MRPTALIINAAMAAFVLAAIPTIASAQSAADLGATRDLSIAKQAAQPLAPTTLPAIGVSVGAAHIEAFATPPAAASFIATTAPSRTFLAGIQPGGIGGELRADWVLLCGNPRD